MAKYKNYQSILDTALGEYAEQGFSLKEVGDHILELSFKGKGIANFSSSGATFDGIKEECQDYLRLLKENDDDKESN